MDASTPVLLMRLLAFVYGAVLGSFAGVVVYRLPRRLSLVRPPSFCDQCHERLSVLDLVPIASYLGARGRCRRCHARIAWMYPVLECGSGLAAVTCLDPLSPPLFPFCRFLILEGFLLCAAIDFEWGIIPDAVTFPLMGLCGGLAIWQGLGVPRLVSGATAGAGVWLVGATYQALRKREGMGGGDVKLAVVMGLLLGLRGFVGAFFSAVFLATVAAIVLIGIRRSDRFSRIPFAPFLAAGTFLVLFTDLLRRLHLLS